MPQHDSPNNVTVAGGCCGAIAAASSSPHPIASASVPIEGAVGGVVEEEEERDSVCDGSVGDGSVPTDEVFTV